MAVGSLTAFLLVPMAVQARGGQEWFSAWSTSHNMRLTIPVPSGKTVRMIVRPTISGSHVRVKLENTMGQSPVEFSAAYIGAVDSGAALVAGSNKQLTFGGNTRLTLGPGAGAYSDPIEFNVNAFERLAVSLDVASASDISAHQVGLTMNFMGPGGSASTSAADGFAPIPEIAPLNTGNLPFYWVAAVDVQSPSETGTIALFGDSITDGRCSTKTGGFPGEVSRDDLFQRWGDLLAERLALLPSYQHKAIANAGISGNALMSNSNGPKGLDRLDRDVLDRVGVTHVVLFHGSNDIARWCPVAPPAPHPACVDIMPADVFFANITTALQTIIDKVHSKGLKIIGATVIPRAGPRTIAPGATSPFTPPTGWSTHKEAMRVAVNEWMRNVANFDGIIDFDALLSAPNPVQLNDNSWAATIDPQFSCGDFLHPNAAGYAVMSEFVDTFLFENIGSWGNGHDGDTANHDTQASYFDGNYDD